MKKSRPISQPHRAIFAPLLAVFALAVFVGSALAANLVANGSFETDSNGDGIPNGWTGYQLTPADKRVCNQSYVGSCSFKIVGGTIPTPPFWKDLYQNIPVSGGAGESYKLTFWIKAKYVSGGGDLTIHLELLHSNGYSADIAEQVVPLGNTAWHKYVLNLTSTDTYTQLYVLIIAESGSGGVLWVDKVKVVPVP